MCRTYVTAFWLGIGSVHLSIAPYLHHEPLEVFAILATSYEDQHPLSEEEPEQSFHP